MARTLAGGRRDAKLGTTPSGKVVWLEKHPSEYKGWSPSDHLYAAVIHKANRTRGGEIAELHEMLAGKSGGWKMTVPIGGWNEYRPQFQTQAGDWIDDDRAEGTLEAAKRRADALARERAPARVEERAYSRRGGLVERAVVYVSRARPRRYPGNASHATKKTSRAAALTKERFWIAPADNPRDRYAAGYDGNHFRTRREAQRTIASLRAHGGEFDVPWVINED